MTLAIDTAAAELQQPATILASGELSKEQRLAGEMMESHGWMHTPASSRELGMKLFDVGWIKTRKFAPVMLARIRHCGYVVKHPHYVEQAGDKCWKMFQCSTAAKKVHAMRLKQIKQNMPKYWNGMERNQFKGRPAYIIGNGPSAELARTHIPKRDRRRGLIFTINGASKHFSGDYARDDFWCTWDWLGKEHWYNGIDFGGCNGAFSLYAAGHAVQGFEKTGGPAHFWHGGNRNPYRAMCDDSVQLPPLEEGLETAFSVLHMAWWLGCNPIVLYGMEHAIEPGATSLHSNEGDAFSVTQADRVMDQHGTVRYVRDGVLRYVETSDYRGNPCWTTPHLHNGAAFLAAQLMWLADTGTQIVNCSNGGLYLIFAQNQHAPDVMAQLEPTGEDIFRKMAG